MLFYKQHFHKLARLKLAKTQAKTKQHPRGGLFLFVFAIVFLNDNIHVIIQK